MKIRIPKYMEELEKMKEEDNSVVCSWIHECENFGIHCYHCKWNANNEIGNYLLLRNDDENYYSRKDKNDNRTLRFLDER